MSTLKTGRVGYHQISKRMPSENEATIDRNVENKWHGGNLQVLYHSSLQVEPQKHRQSSSLSDITWWDRKLDRNPRCIEKKFPEINESDPTEIEESNATSEDNEDVNGDNIINDEQIKKHNLEKSWEFKEPIPDRFINFVKILLP
ncbi:hypothetical protein RhiirC2_793293 [Rhizophagus irregularis]|uniref:Uncharacterized protein n=1 Tax=Rhizophagus irregularis TaxID=588596 RepID=A0A2N1MFN7_9GLOM|nr:hypothetical protein RhiirC2_793293 [Rhizophagus irregularis]